MRLLKWKYATLLLAAILLLSLVQCERAQHYDIVIVNGLVIDGTGSEGLMLDIAISGDRIVRIAEEITGSRDLTVDASGLVVSPGFIDVHAHLEPLPLYPEAESFIRQGVTTALGGPDGSSALPMRAYLDSLEMIGPGINVAYLVGHGSVRSDVLHLDARPPSTDELDQMKSIIRDAMEAGAFGISTGLKYVPGAYAQTDEIIALSSVVSSMGGFYTSHLRDEGLDLIEGVAEAIRISRDADIPVVLTHHKAIGKPMWGASEETLALVDSARLAGLDIRMDQYPYTASYTSIAVLIPAWALEGGRIDSFARRLEDPILYDSIKAGITYNIKYDRGGDDLSRVQIAKFDWKPDLIGKSLEDWALQEGLEPTAENGAELVMRAQKHGGASCIYHVMDESDVKRIMTHPQTMHASDGRLSVLGQGHPHPRAFGTFPRVLGKYVREYQVLSLPEAIRKMTSLPASLLGLDDRGILREGALADITVFDSEQVNDMATFEDPNQFPVGISYVLINGRIALDSNGIAGERNGKVLRGPSFVKRP